MGKRVENTVWKWRWCWLPESSPFTTGLFPKMSNSRLFQTKRVCRQHFSDLIKIAEIKLSKWVENTTGNCSKRVISPFPTVFSKDLYWRHVKNQELFGKSLNNNVFQKASSARLSKHKIVLFWVAGTDFRYIIWTPDNIKFQTGPITESIYRRHFIYTCSSTYGICLCKGRKHGGNRRKCWF